MLSPDTLSQIMDYFPGKMPLCGELVDQGDCHWDCCSYSNSYFLFMPGEWESALQLGYRLEQYEVLDADYLGGRKVEARRGGCCSAPGRTERPYKSLDCRMYPYWYQPRGGGFVRLQASACPMMRLGRADEDHRARTAQVAEMLCRDPDVDRFLRHAQMTNGIYNTVPGLVEPGR
ncbi:hypothetical protein [Actinomadura sp. DC4]|uniref:hypothetical protein n=1 Tax=Actinomadura sp. DC4 TaxID=3055069 RepID=UPI0025AF873F|nr:hypothetical protein [Actinomadura sp. DC4]MDN3358142.1 hypothetical protein [Actinomadura sp. DC4]